MMRFVIAFFLLVTLHSCKSQGDTPDVSHIKVNLPVDRFEKDFFSMDLSNLSTSLDSLYSRHPAFFQDFLGVIMAYEGADTALKYIPMFIRDSLYQAVHKDASAKFSSLDKIKADIEQGLRFVKHYFPKYEAPNGIVTFIGPIDGIATGITTDHRFAIGLQGYLGKDYPAYHTAYIRSIYPAYKSRKFEPDYIPVNCMLSVLNELMPPANAGSPLVEQMVEAGKRLYIVDHLLPGTDDTVVTGYTKAQLDGAYKNEMNIWSHFLTNNLLYTSDPVVVRDYMNESPNTTALGPGSPGFIGQFVGWQIIKKWMDKKEVTLEQMMKTPAKQIFEEAKYKPS